ncbi:hypothetical protein EV360DRAFT_90891 [Lentinula raphanica]|nr:hypothetical protein EV360DRAFT_90891 [Lentinula raphanica]
MSTDQPVKGRLKFNVSLATLSLPGVEAYHFKTYKHPDTISETPKGSQESQPLTPQQEARKRYEERIFRRRAQNREGERETQKLYEERYRQRHREERRYQEDRRRSLRYIENYGAKSFHHYLRRRNGHLQRPDDYVKPA